MRRLAVILGILAVAFTAAVLSAPLWLGAILGWVGPKYGLTFESYERVGYSRFVLRGVEFRRDPVRVTVTRVEADTPLLWLWRRWLSTPGQVIAGDWSTEVQASERVAAPANKERGWVPLQKLLHKISEHLATWVPHVETGRGVVTWPGSEITFGSVMWQNRELKSPDVGFRAVHGSLRAAFPAGGPIEANVAMLDGTGSVVLQSERTSLNANITWWDQPAELIAHFEERGWLPRDAVLRAQDWEVGGDRVKLGAHYAFLRGDGVVEWREGRLVADVSVSGEPVENKPAPPLEVKLRGHGTRGVVVAETLDVSLPGIEAHLVAPVAIDRAGRLRSEPSTFTLQADLAQQPWFTARGSLTGQGTIAANDEGLVLMRFTAGGEDVEAFGTAISDVKANGRFEWPLLVIEQGTLASPDGSEISAQGGLNVRTREVHEVSVEGRIARTLLARWLPAYPKFEAAEISAKAGGPWASITHEGRANVSDLRFEKTHAAALSLDWNGQGDAIEKFVAVLTAAETRIAAEGSVDRTHLTLSGLTFANGETTRFQLERPAELSWGERLQLSEVHLAGPEANVHAALVWGATGSVQAEVKHFRSEWLRELLIFPSTQWTVEMLAVSGQWADGPAEYSIKAGVTVDLGPNRSAQLSTELTGSGEGLKIGSLHVAEGGGVIVSATGNLPILIHPMAAKKWELAEDAPFAFDAATTANPAFWQEITQLIGVDIVDPVARIHFEGSLKEPRGEARLSATRIAPLEGRFKTPWPKIENVNLNAHGDTAGVALEQFTVAIEGQTVRVSGQLQVPSRDWHTLMRNPREFIDRGQIHLEVPDAEIAPFVQFFPGYIAPKGRFQIDLTVQGEESLTGFIRVQDGTSLPLGPLGVLQEINADIRFTGRTAKFEGVTARMGGQTVALQGTAELPVRQPPQLNLTLTGENLPFVRRAGLLVRGDLDLKLTTPDRAPPLISGVVRLRDSLFLPTYDRFSPSGTRGVAGRPPYFALEKPPLNVWGLNVSIQGEKFLRLRTPIFNGTATARFKLNGTLGEPRIAGEAIVDEGSIRLPFANFAVRQGQVRLSVGQPEPQIWLTATTRRFGYDVTMELTGNTSSPTLTFSSSPPLEAEQVLLMVMAGDAPRNEVSTTDRQRVARFGAFFGQSLLGSLGGDSTGADRLTISSGGDISEQGRETYSIEYKMDDRWSLTGEYDEFDDYYGGVKWRIYPRRKEPPDDQN